MGISSESSTLLPQSDLHDSQLPNNKQQDLLLQSWKIPLILVYYGLCSSTLIVINKVAVHTVEAPVFILLLQLLFSAFTVKGCTIVGVLDAEGLQVN
jgi:GDP-mannose transporter